MLKPTRAPLPRDLTLRAISLLDDALLHGRPDLSGSQHDGLCVEGVQMLCLAVASACLLQPRRAWPLGDIVAGTPFHEANLSALFDSTSSWVFASPHASVRSAARLLEPAVRAIVALGPAAVNSFACDVLELRGPHQRRADGSFFTPEWLADDVLERIDFPSRPGRMVDPTCGARRVPDRSHSPDAQQPRPH